MFRVLSLDGISEEGLAPIRNRKDIHLDVVKGKFTEDELCEKIKGYHAVLIRSATRMTEKVIEAADCLQVIGRAGVGIDNVCLPAATKCGIFVCNSPLGNVVAAAEHSIGMIFAACRNIPFAHVSLSVDRKWDRANYVGVELKGRTLGLVGCGRVGSRVARVMQAAGMSVLAYDPYLNADAAKSQGITMVGTLEELFSQANVVSLHIPKTPETAGCVNKALMQRMPKNSIIVNVARGGIINEQDLADCLRQGLVRAAAIDVFDPEPVDTTTNPLFDESLKDKVVLTPHLGASTLEAQLQVALDVSEQVCAVVDGSTPVWAVNKCQRVKLKHGLEQDEVQPLYDLAESLASIAAQIKNVSSELTGLTLELEGDSMINLTSASSLVPYAAIGAAKAAGSDRINIVNIEDHCKERHVDLISREYPHVTRSEMSVILKFADKSEVKIVGTRSTRIPGYAILRSVCDTPCHMRIPTTHTGVLVYTEHEDKPGVLAAVTVALAARGINISDCHLARSPTSADCENRKALALFYISDLDENDVFSNKAALRNDLIKALGSAGIFEVGVITLNEY